MARLCASVFPLLHVYVSAVLHFFTYIICHLLHELSNGQSLGILSPNCLSDQRCHSQVNLSISQSEMSSWHQQSLWIACLFQTRNFMSNCNALKIVKTEPVWFWTKWSLHEFWRKFEQVSHICARKLYCLIQDIFLSYMCTGCMS